MLSFQVFQLGNQNLIGNVTNLSLEFSAFKRICKLLLEDGPYSDLSEKQKVATLLNWIGQTAYQLHDEFDYTEASKDRLADVLEKFNNYFKPQHNMIHAWYHIGTTFSDSDSDRHKDTVRFHA